MRLVADTNILVSASLWRGPSFQLISVAASGKAQIFCCLPLLLELQETLQDPRFALRLAAQGETAISITERFRVFCHEAVPALIPTPPELRDPDDVHVLACAVGAQADAIITGDKDLLALQSYENIPVITVAEALRRLGIS